MSNSIILKDSTGVMSVDLSSTASISRKGVNTGIIIITIPAGISWEEKPGAFSIDLKMVQDRIDIRFTLLDGIGQHRVAASAAAMNALTPAATSYEKLWWLFKHDPGQNKWLYWGDTTKESCTFPVVINEFSSTIEGGGLNLMQNCTLGLTVVYPTEAKPL